MLNIRTGHGLPLLQIMTTMGFEDLYITNGYRRYVTNMDYKKFTLDSSMKATGGRGAISFPEWKKVCPEGKIQNYFYKNNGNLNFSKVSDEWNAGPDSYSNGAAYVDLDNDGDLDIVTNNINDHAFVLENKAAQKFKHNFFENQIKRIRKKYRWNWCNSDGTDSRWETTI